MAFKLTKAEDAQRTRLCEALEAAAEVVTFAIDEANAQIEAAQEKIAEAIDAYNEILSEAAELAEGIAGRMDEEIGNKSEKWQDSDRGQAATEMKAQWEQIDLSPVDTIEIELVEAFEAGHAEELGDLPAEID